MHKSGFFRRVAGVSPDGTLTMMGVREFAEARVERERELSRSPIGERVAGYYRLGQTAEAIGLVHTAVELYRRSVDIALKADCKGNRFRYVAEAERAASAADGLLRSVGMSELATLRRYVREVYDAIRSDRYDIS
ncbi:MAG: hypothetical protein IJU62_04625 [Muribaculaceae bacterium]|nr:hypothetical protein [Muribaculaceae bacterium]